MSPTSPAPSLADWLAAQPRFELGHWPTPLQPLDHLSDELGGPRIWLKRDDCTGLALGGNKTRKLEYLVGAALQEGCDTVVTSGAVQSNHARQTAAACARAGLACHLVLSRQVQRNHPDYERGGNVLLDELLGATLHTVNPDSDDAARIVGELQARGGVSVVPAGGSNSIGALGYVQAAVELAAQATAAGIELTRVYHASSSAGTQAGLLYGLAALTLATELIGINVYHPDPQTLKDRVGTLLERMQRRFGDALPPPPLAAVQVNHAYFGEGYGQPTQETLDAIRLLARTEGVLFDPVYSGKALAGLIDQIAIGACDGCKDVVLLHTGGQPSLFVYDDALRSQPQRS